MIYKTDDEIKSLIERFEAGTATDKEWTHAAHLTAGLWYCLHHDAETAIEKMRFGIFKLNAAHGVENTPTNGYHETLTVFWIGAIGKFLDSAADKTSPAKLANDLIADFPSNYPLKFYSRELLFSPAARALFTEPDILPLPETA